MRVGIAHHVAEGLALFLIHKVDDLVGEPVGGETLFIGTHQPVIGPALFVAGGNTRASIRILKLLPVATVEHEPVIFPTEFTLGPPLRLAIAIQMPFAGVTGGVPLAAQDLGKGDDVITQLDVVVGYRRMLRILTTHERTA